MGKIKILHLVKHYSGNYPLRNSMILGLDPEQFNAKACYLSGEPDGTNILDRYGKAIYINENTAGKSIAALARLLKSEQPDFLHCHRHKPTVIGVLSVLLAGSSVKTKVISHVHGLNRTRSLGRRLTNWLILKHVAAVVTVSESVKEDVIRTNWLAPEKVTAVWNGIELAPLDNISADKAAVRKSMGIPEDAFIYGSVGRLVKTKGYSYLLEAFATVKPKMPDAKIMIIGEGALKQQLEDQASSLGISDSLLFPGFRTDIPAMLRAFDVFVLPSIAEGLSLALIEAMAARLPVIASAVGGIPEVLCESRFGILATPKSTISLSAAMEKLYFQTPQERSTMGQEARKRIEDEFSAVRMTGKIRKIYESIYKR